MSVDVPWRQQSVRHSFERGELDAACHRRDGEKPLVLGLGPGRPPVGLAAAPDDLLEQLLPVEMADVVAVAYGVGREIGEQRPPLGIDRGKCVQRFVAVRQRLGLLPEDTFENGPEVVDRPQCQIGRAGCPDLRLRRAEAHHRA